MQKHVEAIYENGVFKPISHIALREHGRVHLIIEEAENVALTTSGMIPVRNGKTVEIIALDLEFLPEEV